MECQIQYTSIQLMTHYIMLLWSMFNKCCWFCHFELSLLLILQDYPHY